MKDTVPFIFHDLQDSQIFSLAQSAGRNGYRVHGTLPSADEAPWVTASRHIDEYYEMESLGDINMGLYALQLRKQAIQGVFVPVVDDIADLLANYAPLLRKSGLSFLSIHPDQVAYKEPYALQNWEGKLTIPTTVHCDGSSLIKAAKEVGFPVIIKSFREGFITFNNEKTMDTWLKENDSYPFHLNQRIQHYINGSVNKMATALLLFDKDSRPVRGFTARRERVAQSLYGPFGETVAAKAEWIPDLYDAAVELMSALGWVGFAEVECKQDDKGTWHLIEINHRLSGWTCLAEQDGAGLLDAYYHLNTESSALEPNCLQHSTTSYSRIITSEAHQPDWANFTHNTYKSMLKFPNHVCFGAWDKSDPEANRAWASLMLKRFKDEREAQTQ